MARGSYENKVTRKKKRNKSLALILSIGLILSFAGGGTLAYIVTKTALVENQFERANVNCRVNVYNDTIDVTNTGNVVAYIRAAIVVNWMDSAGNVRGIAPQENADYTLGINNQDWYQDPVTDFYYYKPAVVAGGTTGDLVTSISVLNPAPDGYELSVEVVAEAIQAEGNTDSENVPAFQDAWGITIYGN